MGGLLGSSHRGATLAVTLLMGCELSQVEEAISLPLTFKLTFRLTDE